MIKCCCRCRGAQASRGAQKKDLPFAWGCLGRHHIGLGFARGVPPEAKRREKGIGGNRNRVCRAQVDKSMAVRDEQVAMCTCSVPGSKGR